MPRPCSSCNKLASLELGDPEMQSEVELSNGTLTAEVRLIKNSACCGDEMKEYTFNLEQDISDTLQAHWTDKHQPEESSGTVEFTDDNFEVDAGDPETTERTQSKDRHGKPIKSYRYMRNYTGVTIPVTVKCTECDVEVWTGDLQDETANSSFDEL